MILVVDDHSDTRAVITRLFRMDGYETTSAAGGEQALEYLKQETPSLVFLDYHMPGVDGLTVVSEMKKEPRLARVPIIMFTACDRIREQALQAGVDEFMIKSKLDWAKVYDKTSRLIGPGKPLQHPPAQVGCIASIAS